MILLLDKVPSIAIFGAFQAKTFPDMAILLLIAGPILLFLYFFCIKPLWKQGLWKLPRTWYEGCWGYGALHVFFAVFIAITGETPSRYNPVPLDRMESLNWFLYAAIFLMVGAVAFWIERRPQSGR